MAPKVRGRRTARAAERNGVGWLALLLSGAFRGAGVDAPVLLSIAAAAAERDHDSGRAV
jgi:hypothetical protein